MRLKYRIVYPITKDRGIFVVKAFPFWRIKTYEAGEIQILRYGDKFQIFSFHVKENYRQRGIGRALLKKAIALFPTEPMLVLEVYPNSEPYPNEHPLGTEELYHVYHRLGFDFAETHVDLHRPNAKMVLKAGAIVELPRNQEKYDYELKTSIDPSITADRSTEN